MPVRRRSDNIRQQFTTARLQNVLIHSAVAKLRDTYVSPLQATWHLHSSKPSYMSFTFFLFKLRDRHAPPRQAMWHLHTSLPSSLTLTPSLDKLREIFTLPTKLRVTYTLLVTFSLASFFWQVQTDKLDFFKF